MGFMGLDERLDKIDKAINILFSMFHRLLAILVVSRVIDITNVEDILGIEKEKEENGTINSIDIGRLK